MQLALINNKDLDSIAKLQKLAEEIGIELKLFGKEETEEFLLDRLIEQSKTEKRYSSAQLEDFLNNEVHSH